MRRAVIGSEVGSSFTPGFGAIHSYRRPMPRLRLSEPFKYVGYGFLALIVLAAIGHMH